MKKYVKSINGIIYKKQLHEIILYVGGKQIINPTEEMVLENGWVKLVEPIPSERVLLERARRKKLDELYAYDESKEVNDCIIVYQGVEYHYWKDKFERDVLKNTVRDYIAMGRTEYRLDLREVGISITIPCESLLQMMAVLEVYASDCYNRTTDHDFFIKSLTTKEEIDAYEFRGNGYPSIPRFEV